MRKFSSAVVPDSRFNTRIPSYVGSPMYRGMEKYYVMYDDGEGWNVFVEVDNKINAELIATALNQTQMRASVETAKRQIAEANEPPPPATFEERLNQLEARLNDVENS